MAEKVVAERAAETAVARPAFFTAKNIFILVAGVVLSSLFALYTVGNYIAPAIERKKAERESMTASGERNAELESLTFYRIDPIIVNPAGSNGERYLKAIISLESYDPAVIAEVEKRLPQIKNQINTILSSKRIDQVQTNEDRERLRREIQSRINGLLSTGNISNVYFEEFVYQ